jgi:hypothetical protein
MADLAVAWQELYSSINIYIIIYQIIANWHYVCFIKHGFSHKENQIRKINIVAVRWGHLTAHYTCRVGTPDSTATCKIN